MSLGLGANLSKLSNETWSPNRLSSLMHWFRFRTDITTSAETSDITAWRRQNIRRDTAPTNIWARGDGEESTSPNLESNGTIKWHAGANVMPFYDAKVEGTAATLVLGAYSIYFKLNWDASDTIGSNEDLIEADSNNFFKLTGDNTCRFKISGNRHDFTHGSAIVEGTPFVIGAERTSAGAMSVYLNNAASTPDVGEGDEAISNTLRLTQFGTPTQTSYWYEVVICNDALSSTDRDNLYNYLNNVGEDYQ